MARNEVSLRLSVKGREELLAALRAMGGEYEKAAARVEAGSRKSNVALRTVNAASKEAQGGLEDLSSRGGAAGRVLASLGPAGVAAGAGIGAMGVALGSALKISREAVTAFDQVGKQADTLQLTTDAFQALKAAAAAEGVVFAQVEVAMRQLTKQGTDLNRGTGELYNRLKETNPQLLEMLRNTTSNDERLRIITQALQQTESATDRANIAFGAFGESGLGVARMLERQKDGFDGMIDRVRALGLVVREDVIRNAEDMEKKFGQASQIIDLQLKQAFIDLAPFLLETAKLLAGVATEINYIMSLGKEFADRSEPALEKRMAELAGQIAAQGIAEAEVMKALSEGRSLDLGAAAPGVYSGLQQAQVMQYFREMQAIYAEQGQRAEEAFADAAALARQQLSQRDLEARKAALESQIREEGRILADARRTQDTDTLASAGASRGAAVSELAGVNAELARRASMPEAFDDGSAAAAAAAKQAEFNRLKAEAVRLQKDLGDYTGHLAEQTARYHQMLEAGLISPEQYEAAVKAAKDELSGLNKAVETWSALVEASLSPTASVRAEIQKLETDYAAGRVGAELYTQALAALNRELRDAAETERTSQPGFADAERVREALRQAQAEQMSPAELAEAERKRLGALVQTGVLDRDDATDWLEIYSKRLEDAAEKTGLLAASERLLDDVQAGRIRTLSDLGQAFSSMLIDMVRDYLASRQSMQGQSILDFLLGGAGGFGGLGLKSAGAPRPATPHSGPIGQSHSGGSGRFPPSRRNLRSGLLPGEGLQVVHDSETILTASGRMNIAGQIAAMASERQMMTGLIGRAMTAPQGGGMMMPKITVNNYAGAEVTTETRQGADGPEMSIDIKGRMKDMARGGVFDQAFRERYGLRPVT